MCNKNVVALPYMCSVPAYTNVIILCPNLKEKSCSRLSRNLKAILDFNNCYAWNKRFYFNLIDKLITFIGII